VIGDWWKIPNSRNQLRQGFVAQEKAQKAQKKDENKISRKDAKGKKVKGDR
jgi:hypothetical protein